jgi:hypothetical protein
MTERNAKPKQQTYTVHDPAARERYRCTTPKSAFDRLQLLRSNGRTAYVSPKLPEGFHAPL